MYLTIRIIIIYNNDYLQKNDLLELITSIIIFLIKNKTLALII